MQKCKRLLPLICIASLILVGFCPLITGAYQHDGDVTTASRTYKLRKLNTRTAPHQASDAIVHVPKGFDRSRAVRLVIYNHGLAHTVDETFSIWMLGRHMSAAPPNTVLILPEWAANPKEYSSNAGPFHRPGFFRRMLTEIMSRTPELKDTNIEDVQEIAIVTYSGGFRAAATEIYRNNLTAKISNLTLLDSLYRSDHFDAWLKSNLKPLAAGKKQFHNFFFDTRQQSIAQHRRLKQMFTWAGISSPGMLYDTQRPGAVLSASTIARHGIVFKLSTRASRSFSPHENIASIYFPLAMQAWAVRSKTQPQLAMVH